MEINVSFLYKIWSVIKTIFWRNNQIIYINSNKKIQSHKSIDSLIATQGHHWINCQSHFKGNLGIKNYKIHLFRMKRHLYDITRNLDDTDQLVYSGFVSTMFAAYDGYCLGDNKSYCFIDCNSKDSAPYKINYSKQLKNIPFIEKPSTKTVNVLFSCGHGIELKSDFHTYNFNKPPANKITQSYLHEVFAFSNAVFDLCKNAGVERINLYIAAKQPISFVIGTAIQTYHPKVYAYELVGNEYKLALCIQTGKLEAV